MKLSEVKYAKCASCKRPFALAHWVPVLSTTITISVDDDVEDEFEVHNNKLCKPCLDVLADEE